jgi:hypothetical protein
MKAIKFFASLFFFLSCAAQILRATEFWNYPTCPNGHEECMSVAYLPGTCMGEGGLDLCDVTGSIPRVSCAPGGRLPEEFLRCTGLGDPCGVPGDTRMIEKSKCVLGGPSPEDNRCYPCTIIIDTKCWDEPNHVCRPEPNNE